MQQIICCFELSTAISPLHYHGQSRIYCIKYSAADGNLQLHGMKKKKYWTP
jgi:hypothetical protein